MSENHHPKGREDLILPEFADCYAYDLDCDNDVDIVDIMQLASRWNNSTGDPNYDVQYDLNGDKKIDIVDIMQVAAQWGWSQ